MEKSGQVAKHKTQREKKEQHFVGLCELCNDLDF